MPLKPSDVHIVLDRVKKGIDAATRDGHSAKLIEMARKFKGAAEKLRTFATKPHTIAKLNARGARATVTPMLDTIDTLARAGNLGAVLVHSRDVLTTMALPGDPTSVPLRLPAFGVTAHGLEGEAGSVPVRPNGGATKASSDDKPNSVPNRKDK